MPLTHSLTLTALARSFGGRIACWEVSVCGVCVMYHITSYMVYRYMLCCGADVCCLMMEVLLCVLSARNGAPQPKGVPFCHRLNVIVMTHCIMDDKSIQNTKTTQRSRQPQINFSSHDRDSATTYTNTTTSD